MSKCSFFNIVCLGLGLLIGQWGLAIEAQKFCGPLMKTYLVEDLTHSRVGNGIRCVSPENDAFYGEGFWGKSQSGIYKQLGVFKKNELGLVSSVKLIDLGLRRADSESCETNLIGQTGLREYEVRSFARPDRYGNFQVGFVISDLSERWIEIQDLSSIDTAPFEGLNDGNDCMTFTGVQYAKISGSDAFRCVLPHPTDPMNAQPLAWVSKNSDGTLGLGWSSEEAKYQYRSMNCELGACSQASDLELSFAMPTPPESKRSLRLMGSLAELWTFEDPLSTVEAPRCR